MQLPSLLQRVADGLSRESVANRVAKILTETDARIGKAATRNVVVIVIERQKRLLYDCFRDHTGSQAAAQALALKALNLVAAKQQFQKRHIEFIARPFGIVVAPASGCNLAYPRYACPVNAAANQRFDWHRGELSEHNMDQLLKRYGPYAMQILFCNYGESSLNPQTPAFVRAAKRFLLHTVLSTDLAMPCFEADAYVESGLDYMTLSIDGATQTVYEKVRRTGRLEAVYRNIQRLVAARIRARKRTPVLCWQYPAFEHNVHEISQAIYVARSLGVDVFKITTPFDVTGNETQIRAAAIEPALIEFTKSTAPLSENWDPSAADKAEEAIGMEFDNGWHHRFDAEAGLDDMHMEHIDLKQVADYLRAAPNGIFNDESVGILCNWKATSNGRASVQA